MSEKLVNDKKSEKLFYKGNGVIYWFSPVDKKWAMQVKNPLLISTLWKYFYKEAYKPMAPQEMVVFKFHDYRFDEVAEYIHQNYKIMEVVK